jgi:predicted GNAT family N-acyltransferase
MNPRLTAEQRDTVMDGCVEIKNVGGHCVLMSIEAFRAMLRLRFDSAHIDQACLCSDSDDRDCQESLHFWAH